MGEGSGEQTEEAAHVPGVSRRAVMAGGMAAALTGCGMADQSSADHETGGRGPTGLAGILTDGEVTRRVVTRGLRRKGSADRVGADDRWHLGSNGKAMTAALFARLVEQGRLAWEMPVAALFPTLSIHQSWAGCTVDALMSHTSGLTDSGLIGAWALIKSEFDERPLPGQRLALATTALTAPAKGQRGKFAYANANYVVLAAAIEQRIGDAWENIILEELFGPLEMGSAGFGAPTGNQPYGHRRSWLPWGGPKPVSPGPTADNPPFMRPAGGIHMSLEDYAKFLRLFLGGGTLLREESIARLITPVSAKPAYARGWIVETLPWAGGPALVHDGSNTMWYATVIVAPERRLACAAVANEGGVGAQRGVHALARSLLESAGDGRR